MRLRPLVLVPLALAAVLRAQEPLNRPVPLIAAPAAPSPGTQALALEAAQRAQEMGFPALAAVLYRELLAAPGGARADLTLALATALLDGGHPDQAEQVLRGLAGPRGSAWHLRLGLAAAAQRKTDVARAELAQAHEGELTAPDRAWFLYLRGRVAAAAPVPDLAVVGTSYRQAREAATNDLARARFLLAEEEARLRAGPVSAADAETARQKAEEFRGTATGHDFARSYAIMLDGLGRKGEAVAILQRELLTIQPAERERADNCRLLLGLIDGAADGLGRRALLQLLEAGADDGRDSGRLERQRVALQLLGTASADGPARSSFRAELDRLIAAPSPHPILEDLLLFRASGALGDRPADYPRAEADAQALLDKFPGSLLKAYALGILTASDWEQQRYLNAARDAARQQAESAPGEGRAELGVLRAEALFRAGTLAGDAIDFGNAAAAYAAALHDPPANVPASELMFQRVESEIEAGLRQTPPDAARAQRVLDEMASAPGFDLGWRWRAESNLARMLRIGGQSQVAYARVNRLLAAGGAALPTELRARMALLQAQLSLDAHEYDRTLQLVAALRRSPRDGLSADLYGDIAGTSALLEAQADFALKQEAAGLAALEKLRHDFPRAPATERSYMDEAGYYAQQDQLANAQRLFIQLAEQFPASLYAPKAYFEAALLKERLGQRRDLEQANDLIEQMIALVDKYPASDPRHDLYFQARLEQGDILRKLNEFPQAQQTYESLRTDYPRHPDIVYALLALAACHSAQAANDPHHALEAREILAALNDRVDAPVDVRVEAGYRLGLLWQGEGDDAHAETAWWADVVTPFLLAPARAAQLGAGGRDWMAKTLLDLGTLQARQGKPEQAKRAWQLVLNSQLPYPLVAASNLASLDAPAARP